MDPRRIWDVRLRFRTSTRIAVALAALANSVPVTALDPAKQLSQFGYRAWTQQQGLPQDSVRAIAQAPDGALWLGTDEGLARFDGTDFTVFRQSSGGLPGSFISALIAARDGSVWVGTLGGVSRLKDGRFTNYNPANGLGTPTVSDLFESQDGTIWAVGGRIVSAFRGGAIVNYGPEHGVPAEGLRKLVQTRDGVLFGVGFSEVVRFDGQRFQRYANRGELTEEFGTSITLDKDGVLWVGTTRGLVAVSSDGRARRYDAVDGIPASPVRAVLADRDGTLWIGTPNGLARLEGDRFVRVSAPGLRPGVSVWDSVRGPRRQSLGRDQQRPAQVSRAAVHDVRHAGGIPQRPADGGFRGQARHVVDWLSGCRSAGGAGLVAQAGRARRGAAEHRRVLHSQQP